MRFFANMFCVCVSLIAVVAFATSLSADEPDKGLLAAGQKTLKAMKYTAVAIYSKGEKVGTVKLMGGKIAQANDAVVILGGLSLTDGTWDLRNGDVFFNVGKTTKVKVGDHELKQGECVLFKDSKFTKLDLTITSK